MVVRHSVERREQARPAIEGRRPGHTAVFEHADQHNTTGDGPPLEGDTLGVRPEGLILGRHSDVSYRAGAAGHLMATTTTTHSCSRGFARSFFANDSARRPGGFLLSTPTVISEHTALVAAARLQASPPALQEVGRIPRGPGTRGYSAVDGFMKYDADLRRKASAHKGLEKSASYCVQQ